MGLKIIILTKARANKESFGEDYEVNLNEGIWEEEILGSKLDLVVFQLNAKWEKEMEFEAVDRKLEIVRRRY